MKINGWIGVAMSRITIVVPCYNEEETIRLFHDALMVSLQNIPEAEWEIIFVDDGSKDNTYQRIKALAEEKDYIKYISFSRNFGKEAAIFAGLRQSKGDCVVVMDADLQHPPEVILEMYELWKQGFEVVEGIKRSRGKESVPHRLFAKSFYNMISKVIGIDMNNSSDFKLLDRKVVDTLSALKERDTFFRALSYWMGYKRSEVVYDVKERVAGTTKWSFISLLGYAIKNIISFSYSPLYLIIFIGLFILLVGVGFGLDALISFFLGNAAVGYPTLVFLITISTGGIMISLGIVGIYIAKIYEEIKQRPQYIIRDKKE